MSRRTVHMSPSRDSPHGLRNGSTSSDGITTASVVTDASILAKQDFASWATRFRLDRNSNIRRRFTIGHDGYGLWTSPKASPAQFVFGVFHFQKIHFKIVAGIWQEHTIRLYEIGRYSIALSAQAIQFYLVLRDIHHLARHILRNSENPCKVCRSESLRSHLLYGTQVRMRSIEEDLTESGQQPPRQGRANTQQVAVLEASSIFLIPITDYLQKFPDNATLATK
ncbi:hypothetical protein RSOLAG22IIIB_04192 [Rhizoctonia solani]|uniref:Uncharacterized protein n=1 Tax=Rhizoctonia solani TaxID=456999 RepID=A0A0K6FWF6_9AGAM|nr:hypothetical protein RSOLAG22IIIB_04192 [Rhizoctonia solani]